MVLVWICLDLVVFGIININCTLNVWCLIVCSCDDFFMLALRALFDLVA